MNLTQTAQLTTITLTIFSIIFVIGISGWGSYQYWYYQYYLPNKPAVIIPPEVKFGILSKPLLPQTNISPSNYSYSIDTETGSFPEDIPNLVKVFFVPQLGTTLLAPNKARNLADSLGFSEGPQIISSTIYKFSDQKGGELTIDLESSNLDFQRKVATDSAKFSELPDEETLKKEFRSFLKDKNLLNNFLDEGEIRIQYDKNTPQESTTAYISIWPEDIDNLPVVTTRFTSALINATAIKIEGEEKFSSLEYIFWEPDQQNSSTYPIKSVTQAFEDLKKGDGVIIVEPEVKRVSISSAYLAYFQPDIYISYMQPVFVFEGENFAAVVPAITSDYLE